MKLNSKTQLIVALVIVAICYVLAYVFSNMLFRNIGLCLSGLLYAVHPVVPASDAGNKQVKNAVRLAGIFLVCIGLFT